MPIYRNKNGTFAKKKALERKMKCVQGRLNARKKLVQEEPPTKHTKNKLGEGLRIVNLNEMGKNLKCHKCQTVLDLNNTKKETLIGCHSVLTILCHSCKVLSKVNTGKILDNNVSEINAGLVLGKSYAVF